jgi:hypothetical protein
VIHRLSPLLILALLPACAPKGVSADGGIYTTRSVCPLVGVPAGTGDITLFNPAGVTDANAIDVTATITNVRSTCDDSGSDVITTTSFDVVAVRRVPGPARQVVLPYFNTVVQGGSDVVAKRVGAVGVTFADGAVRAQTNGQATARVSRSAATLPDNIRRILSQERKAGDESAAIDPLSDPAVREAVARATFEQLVGFQLSAEQLRYNVTR